MERLWLSVTVPGGRVNRRSAECGIRALRRLPLVPKLLLGTPVREAPLRTPAPGPSRMSGPEAELRARAFPSGAWEREEDGTRGTREPGLLRPGPPSHGASEARTSPPLYVAMARQV